MANELKFENYSETQIIAEDVDLERLVQLFVNHRYVPWGLTALNRCPPCTDASMRACLPKILQACAGTIARQPRQRLCSAQSRLRRRG